MSNKIIQEGHYAEPYMGWSTGAMEPTWLSGQIKINLKVFLCAPLSLDVDTDKLVERIQKIGIGGGKSTNNKVGKPGDEFNLEVFCAKKHSPQDVPGEQKFKNNIGLITQSDIFVAVLRDYGKDLTAEVGMAYAWGMPRIGIDANADKSDVMCYYALQHLINDDQLKDTISDLVEALYDKATKGPIYEYQLSETLSEIVWSMKCKAN